MAHIRIGERGGETATVFEDDHPGAVLHTLALIDASLRERGGYWLNTVEDGFGRIRWVPAAHLHVEATFEDQAPGFPSSPEEG